MAAAIFTLSKAQPRLSWTWWPYTALRFCPAKTTPTYHPGRCGVMTVRGRNIGVIGQIHPQCAQNYGIGTEVYMAEIDMKKLFALRDTEKAYRPLPKYPAVTRDLAVVVREDVTVLELRKGHFRRGRRTSGVHRPVRCLPRLTGCRQAGRA